MISSFFHFRPVIARTAYVHAQALVVGRVHLGRRSSIWPGAVLRGDIHAIRIGKFTNIQDHCVLHVGEEHPVEIGDYVVAGHAARLHGCRIGNRVQLGIGCTVLNGAVVPDDCILAAGALVPENSVLEPGNLYMGIPATLKRKLRPEEIEHTKRAAIEYAHLAEMYRSNEAALRQGRRLTEKDFNAAVARARGGTIPEQPL